MRDTILVVTNREDLHASEVIRHLARQGRRVFRFNTEGLLLHHELSIRQSDAEDSLVLHDRLGARSVRGEEIAAVYFRRPAPPEAPAIWGGNDRALEVVRAESRWFLRWLWAWLSDVPWFTADPMVIDRAACKPLQLRIAREVGLQVPATLYGNDAGELSKFMSAGKSVVKPIRETGFERDGLFHAFYTAVVDEEASQPDAEALGSTINFLQKWLPKRDELRVTWVDGKCLAARIHSQSGPEPARIDWRKVPWQDLEHSEAEIPAEVAAGIGRYCARMGIRFGALDFIVTPEGQHVFLECNPNGQWLWLDEKLSLGIGQAIADSLASHCAA